MTVTPQRTVSVRSSGDRDNPTQAAYATPHSLDERPAGVESCDPFARTSTSWLAHDCAVDRTHVDQRLTLIETRSRSAGPAPTPAGEPNPSDALPERRSRDSRSAGATPIAVRPGAAAFIAGRPAIPARRETRTSLADLDGEALFASGLASAVTSAYEPILIVVSSGKRDLRVDLPDNAGFVVTGGHGLRLDSSFRRVDGKHCSRTGCA